MTDQQLGGVCSRATDEPHHVRYERTDGEPVSVATAIAIATYRGEAPTAGTTQLYEYVDPDALDALFAPRQNGAVRCPGEVRIDLPNATVVIDDATITVSATERTRSRSSGR